MKEGRGRDRGQSGTVSSADGREGRDPAPRGKGGSRDQWWPAWEGRVGDGMGG